MISFKKVDSGGGGAFTKYIYILLPVLDSTEKHFTVLNVSVELRVNNIIAHLSSFFALSFIFAINLVIM